MLLVHTHSPSGILLELVEHGPLAILKDEVKLLFSPKHLDKVDQIRVLQVLEHLDLAHRYLLNHRIILRFLAVNRRIILSWDS